MRYRRLYVDNDLKTKLILLKDKKKMNQPDFAEFIGVSVDTIKSWMSRSNPSDINSIKLEKIFIDEGIK
jgi:DNA-binding transcriptional regulator YiaG